MPEVLLPSELSPSRNYFLLTSLLVPRPIAWVSTRSQEGVVNVAPFSFYGGISGNPPILGLGISRRADGRRKDTAQNAIEGGEFVVHLAEEPLVTEMVMKSTPPLASRPSSAMAWTASRPSRVTET